MTQSQFVLGLDIGGTKSAAVVGRADGSTVNRRAMRTPQSAEDGVPALIGLLKNACRDAGVEPIDTAALGVSFGGPWDSVRSRTGNSPVLPGWRHVELRDVLRTDLGIRVGVENDANATALAEWKWGGGQGYRDLAFVTMGTGIGAGLILTGSLYRGRSDLAGEIGHTTMIPDGTPCPCGKRGCLETLASGTAIGRMGQQRYGDPAVDAVEVCTRARRGDSIALGIVQEAAGWMGIAVGNLLQTLNLERVILGTMAIEAGDLFLDAIIKSAQRHCWAEVWEGASIVAAGLGPRSQDLAALAVAVLAQ